MDDIYADLENYDDFNTIEELKTENNQLKCKLDEYALAMEKLKKDYDTLTTEYKHLERNYSSLLKTARAEIERKTHIITQLNKEKDLMVLTSMQNKNKSLLNITRNFQNHIPTKCDKPVDTKKTRKGDKNIKNKRKDEQMNIEQEKKSSESGRKEENNTRTEDTVLERYTDSNVEYKFAEGNIHKYTELHRDNKRDTKENKDQVNRHCKDDIGTTESICAKTVINRRKSLSDVRYSRFSSDDECVDKYVFEANRRQSPLRTGTEIVQRKNDDRQSNKVSETSSIDDKYSNYYYHESREENYYKNKTRQNDIDKHRHRDKSESHSRYRRRDSSERFHPRTHRSHNDDQQSKLEHDKYRVESSSFDRHHYRQKSHERRFIYERERDYFYDYGRHPHDSYSMKHKIQSYYEGPQNKRIRTNSYNKHANEDKILYREPEFVDKIVMPASVKNIRYASCQSPDYIPTDTGFSNPVREIKNTAVTHLEDPRVTSKKYIIKTQGDNTLLSTIRGRNVEIKVIDKSIWKIQRVKVPEALLHHPSKYSEQMIKDINMDVDNPVTNMSVKSSEFIDFDTHESRFTGFASGNFKIDQETERRENNFRKQETENIRNLNITNTNKYTLHQTDNDTAQLNPVHLVDTIKSIQNNENVNEQTNDKEIKVIEKKTDESTTNQEDFSTTFFKYRIPKLKKSNKDSSHQLNATDVGLCENEDQSDENNKNQTNVRGHAISEIDNQISLSNNETCIDYIEKSFETLQKKSGNEDNKILDENIDKPINEDDKVVDLLSDNAIGDNYIGDGEFGCKEKKTVTFGGCVEGDLELSNETIDHLDLQKQRKQSVEELPESAKKRRSDNKADTKQEEVNDPSGMTRFEEAINKKGKAVKEFSEITTKFSTLFGDTCSLITPEDLDIQTQSQSPATYGPVYEDAQNAVDFDMNEMIKVQMRSSTPTENKPIEEKQTVSDNISKNNETEFTTINISKGNSEKRKKSKKSDGAESCADFDMEAISKGQMMSQKTLENKEIEKKVPTITINITKLNMETRRKSKKSDRAQNVLDIHLEKTKKDQIRSSKPIIEDTVIEEEQNISEINAMEQKPPIPPTNIAKVSVERKRKSKKSEVEKAVEEGIEEINKAQMPLSNTAANILSGDKQLVTHHIISQNTEIEEKQPMATVNISKVGTQRRRKSKKSEETQNTINVGKEEKNKGQMQCPKPAENILIEEKQTVSHTLENSTLEENPPMTTNYIIKVSTERQKSKKSEEAESAFDMDEMNKARMRTSNSADNVLIEDKPIISHIISENNETEEKKPRATINVDKISTQRTRKSKKDEEAQNAIAVDELNKSQMQSSKLNVENILIEEKQTEYYKISENNEVDGKQSMIFTNIAKLSTEIENSKKNKESTLAMATETANEYKNLNAEFALTQESDIVNTVIISTGIQTQYTDNILEPATNNNENVNKEQNFISRKDIIGTSIIALATSTPYKTLQTLQNEVDPQAQDSSSVSSEGKINKDIIPPVTNVTTTSGVPDSRPDADEPDVRIVVKRRRRVIKK